MERKSPKAKGTITRPQGSACGRGMQKKQNQEELRRSRLNQTPSSQAQRDMLCYWSETETSKCNSLYYIKVKLFLR